MKNSRVYRFAVSAGVVAAALAGLSTAAHAQTIIISSGGSPVNDGGFETPTVPNPPGHAGDPATGVWTFTGSSGISLNTNDDNTYSVVGGPVEGTQYAYLQVGSTVTSSSVSQTFDLGASPMDLSLSYVLAGRQGPDYGGITDFTVLLDGNVFDSEVTATDEAFTPFSDSSLAVLDDLTGSHTITFTATQISGTADNTALLDKVNLVATPTATPEPGMVVTGLAMLGTTGLGLVRGRRRAKHSS